jgi:predicted metal-binding membrane protein
MTAPLPGQTHTTLERALRHDQRLAVGLLVILSIACWAWLGPMALDMYGSMQGSSAWMMGARWNAPYTLLIVTMWVAMMTAMMLPSAVPTLLLYGLVVRSDPGSSPAVRVYIFAAGYLLVWGAFGAAMALVQRELSLHAAMTAMMELQAGRVSGVLLILAGLYQLTPAKQACLRTCQSPAGFISRNWRTGNTGALQLGLRHGLYCLGCCWALMLLLFVLGVMHLPVLLGLTVFLIVEKMAPRWLRADLAGGVLLTVFGVWMLVSGWQP